MAQKLTPELTVDALYEMAHPPRFPSTHTPTRLQ